MQYTISPVHHVVMTIAEELGSNNWWYDQQRAAGYVIVEDGIVVVHVGYTGGMPSMSKTTVVMPENNNVNV